MILVFNIISAEIGIKCNICEFFDKNFEFTNKQRKKLGNEYNSQFEDYRNIKQDEKKQKTSPLSLAI